MIIPSKRFPTRSYVIDTREREQPRMFLSFSGVILSSEVIQRQYLHASLIDFNTADTRVCHQQDSVMHCHSVLFYMTKIRKCMMQISNTFVVKLELVNHMRYTTNSAGMKRVKQHCSVGATVVGKALESVVQVLLKSVSSQQ